MNFFKRLFQRKIDSTEIVNKNLPLSSLKETSSQDDYVKLGIASPASQEEKELISVITSAIMVGDNPNTSVDVKGVYIIDELKEAAALMACVVAAQDNPTSSFKLKTVTEL